MTFFQKKGKRYFVFLLEGQAVFSTTLFHKFLSIQCNEFYDRLVPRLSLQAADGHSDNYRSSERGCFFYFEEKREFASTMSFIAVSL